MVRTPRNRDSASTQEIDHRHRHPFLPLVDTGREEKDVDDDLTENASDIILADEKSADDLFADFNESLLDDLLTV